jgi:putative membrane-bound dehydrogenase-like protein
MCRIQFGVVSAFGLLLPLGFGFGPPAGVPLKSPLSPKEEMATFRIVPGFRVELAAAEPEVIDPVAMCFDEDGRMYVVEMRGYPNGGIGEGKPNLSGRVKRLEDRDGDGYFETATVFVDDLRFPCGVCVWKGGIFVADAPDLLWCADTDNDGKADVRRVVFTGFGARNIQGMVNSLQFHLDNHIHSCNNNDSLVSVEGREQKVPLRGRHFRFDPRDPATLEPTSGGGQYGLSSDDWGNWFTCTNSQHLRHIVLPDHYLRRNPYVVVPTVVADIPDGNLEHTPAAKVFRISPFEPWRLERTSRRVKDPEYNRRLPASELVPGGYMTSATGLTVYRGGIFPPDFDGNVFVADPANNLIHRDVLLPVGATFIAKRHESERDCEFLASTDIWFRPVFLTFGPDGALYVCDFYREIIETPLSLPEDIQKQYNLNSRDRGRIWRIRPEQIELPAGYRPEDFRPKLSQVPNEDLVGRLAHPNAWHRLTAQRLLIERDAKDVTEPLTDIVIHHPDRKARIHALWTLQGLGQMEPRIVLHALQDRTWQVREQALRLAEPWYEKHDGVRKAALRLVNDPVPRVRFQLAFSLGEVKGPEAAAALAELARKDGSSPWVRSAVLSSVTPHAAELMRIWQRGDGIHPDLIAGVAVVLASTGTKEQIEETLLNALRGEGPPALAQCRLLEGMAQALARKGHPLRRYLENGTDNAADSLANELRAFFRRLIASLDKVSEAERVAYVRLLGQGRFDLVGDALGELLSPQTPVAVQTAAIQALSLLNERAAVEAVLEAWPSLGPSARREAQEMLFARTDRLGLLLDALEKNRIPAMQLDPARRDLLLKHPDAALRSRAARLLAAQVPEDRKKVLEEYRVVLDLIGNPTAGKGVFKQHCASCHRLENEGIEVGPDLPSVLKTKAKETLLIDILDPSREVDPRYLNYVVRTVDGRLISGMIASETATSLILRRAEKAEDQLLRSDIEAIQATSKSLMPEGLEKQIKPQELADLIAYLLQTAGK